MDERPTVIGDRPTESCRREPARCPWMPDFTAELRDSTRREQWSYAAGYGDGLDAGYAAARREMAAWWARLAASVRQDANRLKGTVPEPAARSNGSTDDSIWFTADEWATWAGAR